MATERFHSCTFCKYRQWASPLFDALKDFAEGNPRSCPSCGNPMGIELRFPFGLGPDITPARSWMPFFLTPLALGPDPMVQQ